MPTLAKLTLKALYLSYLNNFVTSERFASYYNIETPVARRVIRRGRHLHERDAKEWSQLWAAMKAQPDAWLPTTEAMYDEMLGVLPPARQSRGAFLVGEPSHTAPCGYNYFACFRRTPTGIEARYLTFRQYDAGEPWKS